MYVKKYFRLFHFFIPSHGMYVPRLGIYVPRHGIYIPWRGTKKWGGLWMFYKHVYKVLSCAFTLFQLFALLLWLKNGVQWLPSDFGNWCGLWHLPVMVNWWLVARCFVRLLFLLLCPIYRKSTLDMWTMLKRCCFGRKLFVQLWFSLYLCTVLLQ